jgi:hypothetical protein
MVIPPGSYSETAIVCPSWLIASPIEFFDVSMYPANSLFSISIRFNFPFLVAIYPYFKEVQHHCCMTEVRFE